MPTLNFKINKNFRHRLILSIAISIGILLLLHLAVNYIRHGLGLPNAYGIVKKFDLNTEANIPTYFSTLLWLTAAILAFLITRLKYNQQDKTRLHWLGIALCALFLSIDENTGIHELLNRPMRELHEFHGIFYYAWTIPYMALGLLFVACYSRFLLGLPHKVLYLFLLSGGIFVGGAVGFEMLGGAEREQYGRTITHLFFYTAEEALEMTGVSLFI